jgi:magnesium transporter
MLRALAHTPEKGWHEVDDLARLSDLCDRHGARVWVEADAGLLTEDDIRTIAAEFGLHHLAVEDAMNRRERPKLEQYEAHLFAVLHQLDESDGQLEPVQISCFIGLRYVIIVHAQAGRIIEEARRRLVTTDEEVWGGSAFLVHTLLDTLVDDYQLIADGLEGQIELLEETLLADPDVRIQRELYSIKQRVARFRRFVLPVGRILATVVEPGRLAAITPEIGAHFRDVQDHALRIADQIRNVQDLADALLEFVRMEQASAQNEVTKRLTAWAAIIAIPTLVASIYGMNFRLYPTHEHLGFWFALSLMAAIAVALFVYFKRREWI